MTITLENPQTRRTTASKTTPFASIEELLFPPGYKLLLGTTQIYEIQLAAAESRALSKQEIIERGAYFASIDETKTNHFRLCGVSPVQVDSSSSARRKNFFQANLFKTGYATHGLFPYRGKFHPQMIKAVINTIGLKPGDQLLDPMMGSGTACLEASLLGVNAIGIDASPFCVLMATGKQEGALATLREIKEIERAGESLFDQFHVAEPDGDLFRWIAHSKGKPKFKITSENFVHLCYLDAMGYAARRRKKQARDLFPVVLERYVGAARNFVAMRDELQMTLGTSRYVQGDARDLSGAGIADNSIDGIVTSPPYSFAIDYLANDAQQLEYLGVDADELRLRMIGLRGKNLAIRVQEYLIDMQRVFKEASRVLKPGAYAVFIVGTNSNQLKRAMGTGADELKIDEEFVSMARAVELDLVQDVIHPIEGIHNTMRDEHLLFFRK